MELEDLLKQYDEIRSIIMVDVDAGYKELDDFKKKFNKHFKIVSKEESESTKK